MKGQWQDSIMHQIVIKLKYPVYYKYTDHLSSIGDIRYQSHRKDYQLLMVFELVYYLDYHKCKKLNLHYKHEIKVIKILESF